MKHNDKHLFFLLYLDVDICSYSLICINFLQLFDRELIKAVLNEWQKTMIDLPAGIRQACEMVQCIIFVVFKCVLT